MNKEGNVKEKGRKRKEKGEGIKNVGGKIQYV
jgi:hypothetical protein